MALWPSYARLVLAGASEAIEPSVLRTEMERGIAKQRVINSSVLARISGTVLFQSKTDIASFDTWYLSTIFRIDWFDVTHPRTGAPIVARFPGGEIGDLQPAQGGFAIATRSVVLEYLR